MEKVDQKSWKDRMPPDGHLPASYEVQVCDEGNKVIAVQMLDKAGVEYKISARKGQFFIQACDMETFTKIKGVLNQSLDMNKEADKLGFKPEIAPEVTPVATNTPQADITAASVAVTEPVKEDFNNDGSGDKDDPEMVKAFKEAGCDEHQWDVWVMAWKAAKASKG